SLSLTDSAATQLSKQMRASLSLTDSAATQLSKQMRANLSLTDSVATQLAKQMRIDLLPNRVKIPEELLLTVEHFSQDAVVLIIDSGVADNVDESDSKLINESLNPDNNNLPKYSREKLSAWVPKVSEEHRAYLIDYRKSWYEGKPLTWRTDLYVYLLTLQFLLIDVLWSHISYQLQKWFRPVRRPRL
ncbi:hypothetical protein, partial [uncultured Nostoc sp.]